MQSHHALQSEWALVNFKNYGYDFRLAPTISLETNRKQGGFVDLPHSNITAIQISSERTSIRKNPLTSDYTLNNSLQDQLILGAKDLIHQGFSEDIALRSLEDNYKMINKLNEMNATDIDNGKLTKLEVDTSEIKKAIQEEAMKTNSCKK